MLGAGLSKRERNRLRLFSLSRKFSQEGKWQRTYVIYAGFHGFYAGTHLRSYYTHVGAIANMLVVHVSAMTPFFPT